MIMIRRVNCLHEFFYIMLIMLPRDWRNLCGINYICDPI